MWMRVVLVAAVSILLFDLFFLHVTTVPLELERYLYYAFGRILTKHFLNDDHYH